MSDPNEGVEVASKRVVPDKIRTWLVDELETWRREEILSAQQTTRILALHETPADVAEIALD
ncbi:MAG: hypothetical protein JW888_11305 [Pirellulales bacterium]|nr:hypothetical protein [Pirellulales bacterium]